MLCGKVIAQAGKLAMSLIIAKSGNKHSIAKTVILSMSLRGGHSLAPPARAGVLFPTTLAPRGAASAVSNPCY